MIFTMIGMNLWNKKINSKVIQQISDKSLDT
jgi:hypothetical protein